VASITEGVEAVKKRLGGALRSTGASVILRSRPQRGP